ncbi:MAG: BRCT domain-containing protein [Lysobacterales bacterium]
MDKSALEAETIIPLDAPNNDTPSTGKAVTAFFARQGGAYVNEMNRSLGALLGIAQGMLSDGHLADGEIQFLQTWLESNSAIATVWPGDIIYHRVKTVLEDGIVTEAERKHLTETLQSLLGGTMAQLANDTHVTQLLPYEKPTIVFRDEIFCLTGDFVYAPRKVCEGEINALGGLAKSSVSKKLNYLVVGGLGSNEWKHGSFGTKIESVMRMKKDGLQISIVHEDHWVNALVRAGRP